MKLGLGTAQFGMDYGISNAAGRTPQAEVERILELAARNGIRLLDTAAGYGESESVLGLCIGGGKDFDVVTKTPALRAASITAGHAARVKQAAGESLAKLRLERLYGLLLHNAGDLLAENGDLLMRALLDLKQQGAVSRIGVSVYDARQIDAILARYAIDLIQLPFNVLDQRLLASGHLARLQQAGVEIHARSVFLQGLLLMPPDAAPDHFAPIREHLAGYHRWLNNHALEPLQAALGLALGAADIDRVILGVNTAEQLRQILAASSAQVDARDLSRFALNDARMLDPSLWQLK